MGRITAGLCLLLMLAGACRLGGPGRADPDGGAAGRADAGGDPIDPTDPDAASDPVDREVSCAPITAPSGIDSVIACVPEGMEGKTGSPAPLVVALHGYTQTAEEYKTTTEWHLLAARYGFYVVFPQTNGDLVNAGGLPAAWKWWRDYSPWTRSSFNQHYAPILAVVDAMKETHDIDDDRVFITGLSAGGYMTTLMLATHPDLFAAGASFSGGPHNCDLECTDSNKVQDWTRPPGYQPPTAADVINAYPDYWNDPATRKPRLILFHGTLDEAVKPINLDDAMRQWTGALGIDTEPDNAALGEPSNLGGYEYRAYAHDGAIGVATVRMTGLGHGTPVAPGAGTGQGGVDPIPSQTAADCSNVSDPGCEQDWTNSGAIYGPYEAARFFGLTD
jgi:poly(hydroxyalkanoate) depolymerase family esterase